MASLRFEVEKLTDKSDFVLWKTKVKALLTLQGLETAIQENEFERGKEKLDEVIAIGKKAHSLLILCLGDKALRQVCKESTAIGVWNKLEYLYNQKTLANRLYVKYRLYAFRMTGDQPVLKQLDTFNKLIAEVENIGVEIQEEDKALLLLSALPQSLEHFKDALQYVNNPYGNGEESITLEKVQMTLRSNDLQNSGPTYQIQESTDGFYLKKTKTSRLAKKKLQQKSFQTQFRPPQSFSNRISDMKCFHCNSTGHFRRQCPRWREMMNENRRGEGERTSKNQANHTSKDQGYVSVQSL